MNKVITINLRGRLITIDETAFQQLNAYLHWLKQFFAKEDGGLEIYTDMEDRIAELFQDKLRKSQVSITDQDVQSVIKIMGSPEQIALENSEISEEKIPVVAASNPQFENTTTPRLMRINQGKMLGGVSTGIAQYFGIDVAIIRILMLVGFFAYGATVIVYLLLWATLPVQEGTAQLNLKRRWYRNMEGRVLGGVCSGLSTQLSISKQALRLLFGFPIIGMVIFGILNESDLLNFCIAALPTLALIYIVLWMALPKANSLTEIMELKGERLDVHNINSALRAQNESGNQGKVRNESNVFVSMIRVLAYIVLGFILLVFGGVFIGLFIAFLGLLFGFSVAGMSFWPLTHLVFESQTQAYLMYASAILLMAIPTIRIIRWLISRATNKKPKIKWIGYSLSALFIVSLFALIFSVSDFMQQFKVQYQQSEKLVMIQPTDTLEIATISPRFDQISDEWETDFIRQGNNGVYELKNASFNVLASPNDSFYLELVRQSNGKNLEQAKALAMSVPYVYEQDTNQLRLPRHLSLGEKELFRAQILTAQLFVPVGKVFKIGQFPSAYAKSWSVKNKPFYRVAIKTQFWEPNSYYRMEKDGKITKLGDSTEEVSQ